MRYRTTFILMMLVCLGGLLIWILEWRSDPADVPRTRGAGIYSMEPERLSYVSFYWDGIFIECVNEQGQWFVNRPVRDRADNGAIDRIISVISMLPVLEIITLDERRARDLSADDYGLASPRAWVVLGEGNKRRKLNIGGDSPLRDAVYVRMDGEDDIMTTSTNVLAAVIHSADEIRDRWLFRGAPSYVTRFDIKPNDKPMLSLTREGSEWIIRKPALARADWLKVSAVLDSFFSARIKQFVSESMSDPAAYGVGEDEAVLWVGVWQGNEQEGEVVLFGKPADTQREMLYAHRKGSSSIYAVEKRKVDMLGVSAAELRDSRLYFMAADRARSVQLDVGDKTLRFDSDDGNKWNIVKPHQWPADVRVVTDLLNRLNSVRISAFVNAAETNLQVFGLDVPSRVVRMWDHVPDQGPATQAVDHIAASATRLERTLKIGEARPGQDFVFARFDDNPQVYQISAASVLTLDVDPLKYRDPEVLALNPSVIRSITLKKENYEESVELDSSGAWVPVSLSAAEADLEVIEAILSEVSSLSAARFECSGAKNLAVYRLQPPLVSLSFGLTGEGGVSKALLFGADSEDLGVYTMIQGQDVVFVLEKEKVALLLRGLTR